MSEKDRKSAKFALAGLRIVIAILTLCAAGAVAVAVYYTFFA